MARRATFINQLGLQTEGSHILLVSGGNTLWGASPSSSTVRSNGLVMAEAMNLLGYQAMSLGPTDLLLGADALRRLVEQAQFPILSANAVVQSTGELLARPHALIEIGGRRLGVIGVAAVSDAESTSGILPPSALAQPLTIADPLKAVRESAQELLTQTDLIFVLSGLDWDANVQLAESVQGIDLLIGSRGDQVLTERWQSPTTGTLLWQLGSVVREYPGWMVSLLRLHIDSSGAVTDQGSDVIRLGPEITEDPAVLQLIATYDVE